MGKITQIRATGILIGQTIDTNVLVGTENIPVKFVKGIAEVSPEVATQLLNIKDFELVETAKPGIEKAKSEPEKVTIPEPKTEPQPEPAIEPTVDPVEKAKKAEPKSGKKESKAKGK